MPHTNQLTEEKWIEQFEAKFSERPAWLDELRGNPQRFNFLRGFINNLLSQTEQECDKKWRALIESKRQMEHYDNMICSKCKRFIRERTSHHSEDGFSVCCGKKLERAQGETDNFSTYNSAIDDLLNNNNQR